ncbi:hypothetical protein LP419_32120 [Massilia sp. H-1]|nr:hypothetical protein LP419_32120 [Massilia sp. H-1]
MKKMSLPIATAVLVSGCGFAPANKFDYAGGNVLRNQTVGYTLRSTPRFQLAQHFAGADQCRHRRG